VVLPPGRPEVYAGNMETDEILGTREFPPTPERPWAVRITVGMVDGKPAIVALELYAVDPAVIATAARGWPEIARSFVPATPTPITASGARLPLGSLLADYVASQRKSAATISHAPEFPERWRAQAERRMALLTEPDGEGSRPRGRPLLYDRAHYERVAATYLDALAAGLPPTGSVASSFGASKATASKWLTKCRALGLLPPTTRGVATGWPTKNKKNTKKKGAK